LVEDLRRVVALMQDGGAQVRLFMHQWEIDEHDQEQSVLGKAGGGAKAEPEDKRRQ